MSTGITIQVDSRDLNDALSTLLSKLKNPAPALELIGAAVESQTKLRLQFEKQAPDGPEWTALDKLYAIQKAAVSSGGILDRDGGLLDSIIYKVSGDELVVGSNLIYAAIHQFGGQTRPHEIRPKNGKALKFGGKYAKVVHHPGSTIPARPFLGVSNQNRDDILDLLTRFLEN